MISLVLLAALAVAEPSSPAASPAKVRVFVLDLKTSSVEPAVVSAVTGALVEDLARYQDLTVLSKEDVRRAISLEAEKQTMGCADDTSCLAEAAAAMGAELALFGEIQRVEGAYVAQLNLLDVASVESRGRVSIRGATFEELTRAVPNQMRILMTSTYDSRGWTLPAATVAEPSPLPYVVAGAAGGAAALGLVLAVVGLVPAVQYGDAFDRITAASDPVRSQDRPAALVEASAARKDGVVAKNAWETWGLPLVVTGAVLATAGLAGVVGGLAWGVVGGAE